MKKFLSALLCLTFGLATLSASAETKTLRINKKIDSIEAEAGVNVIYKPTSGGNTTVVITGEAKRIEKINVKVSGKTLEVKPKSNWKNSFNSSSIKGVTITVTSPIFSEVEASSGARITCSTPISASNRKISLEASSGAKISFPAITAKGIELETSSGSSVNVTNLNATTIEMDASSGSSIKVGNIKADRLKCEASSAGSVKISGGQVDRGDFEASSAASIKAPALRINHSSIDKSSSGSVKISN